MRLPTISSLELLHLRLLPERCRTDTLHFLDHTGFLIHILSYPGWNTLQLANIAAIGARSISCFDPSTPGDTNMASTLKVRLLRVKLGSPHSLYIRAVR